MAMQLLMWPRVTKEGADPEKQDTNDGATDAAKALDGADQAPLPLVEDDAKLDEQMSILLQRAEDDAAAKAADTESEE